MCLTENVNSMSDYKYSINKCYNINLYKYDS